MRIRRAAVLWAALSGLAILAGAAPACAEENRLLPFWGAPYPAGYVGSELDCTVVRHIRTKRGLRTVIEDRCPAVLHARG